MTSEHQNGPVDDQKFSLQDSEYSFPYHYLPHIDPASGVGMVARRLGWGLEYLTYLLHCRDLVADLGPTSLLDVGCGDGRFLGLFGGPVDRRVGLDLSENAIRFATAFNPNAEFRVASSIDEQFDVVTAIEVLEHIPPDEADGFIRNLVRSVRPGGHIVISVPTVNARLQRKHYRHFTLETLIDAVQVPEPSLSLQSSEFLATSRPDALTRVATLASGNRYWKFDFLPLQAFLWNRTWQRRVSTPDRGRHLVTVWRKAASSVQ